MSKWPSVDRKRRSAAIHHFDIQYSLFDIRHSLAVTASILWDKSTYSSFWAISKTAILSVGRSRLIGSLGPGLIFSRLWSFLLFQRQRVTLRRPIIKSSQVRVIEVPVSLASSIVSRTSTLCRRLSQLPFISPTNPHSFFFATPPVLRPALQEPVLSLPIPFLWHHSFLFLPEDISLFESLMVCSFQLCRGWGSSGRPTGSSSKLNGFTEFKKAQ